jgi:hypothetical protein
MPPKLLIIGLDSATYDVIRPAAELGLVPHIARLMAEGTSLTLLSSRPPLTPVAWTTMMTGVSAGRHGILDFRELTPGTYFLERSAGTLCRSKQLWRLLSDAGLTVGAYNFPWTDTRGPINGFLIGGKDLAGTPARCQPRALAKELQAVFGLSALDDLPPSPTDGQYDMEELRAHVYSLFGVAGHLLSRQPLDAFGVNLMATDHVQHHVVGLPSADGRPHQTLLGLYQAIRGTARARRRRHHRRRSLRSWGGPVPGAHQRLCGAARARVRRLSRRAPGVGRAARTGDGDPASPEKDAAAARQGRAAAAEVAQATPDAALAADGCGQPALPPPRLESHPGVLLGAVPGVPGQRRRARAPGPCPTQ